MKPPETYAEWSAALTELENSLEVDTSLVVVLEAGRIAWGSGVAERITQRFADVFNARLKRISTLLQRDLNVARGDELVVVRAILAARRRLQVLARVASLPALLDEVRAHWHAELQNFAERTQHSLEDSAITADRSGRLRQVFRDNALTAYIRTVPVLAPTAEASSAPPSGRRVIF